MQSRQTIELVLQALPMAMWRGKPSNKILVHFDQGSQFTSIDRASFLNQNNLENSPSRRRFACLPGNDESQWKYCHDNAVAKSFFNLLKTERIRRKVYKTRDTARQDVFDYIENVLHRKHANNGLLSPMVLERQQKLKTQGV